MTGSREQAQREQRILGPLIVVFLAAVHAIYSIRAVLYGHHAMMALVTEAACTVVMACLLCASYAIQRRWGHRGFALQFLVGAVLAGGCSLVFLTVSNQLVHWLPPRLPYPADASYLLRQWLLWLPVFAVWSALMIALSLALEARDVEQRLAMAERLAHQAELRTLKYQINPHLLFNTLNSISALIWSGEHQAADRLVVGLSQFFRASFEINADSDVTLAQEFNLQRLYLDIEKTRFADRLAVDLKLPSELARAAVPGLILQPLVESAIRQCTGEFSRDAWLSLIARRDGDALVVEVENGGEPAPAPRTGTDAAVDDVRRRLANRFGGRGSLETIGTPGGGRKVSLAMPLVGVAL